LIEIQEVTESLVVPYFNSWEGLSDDIVKKIVADYSEASEKITQVLNKMIYAEVIQKFSGALTALQIPIDSIKGDIQTIAKEMKGVSNVASGLVNQIDERNTMITQITETTRKIIDKLNNVFK
jgi:prophage DNA circulation protein